MRSGGRTESPRCPRCGHGYQVEPSAAGRVKALVGKAPRVRCQATDAAHGWQCACRSRFHAGGR